MLEFDLPILGPDTPIEDAFAPMIEHHKSGVVCRGGSEARIVTFDALLKAHRAGRSTLVDVPFADTDQALVVVSDIYPTLSDPDALWQRLSARSLKYGIVQGSYLARILSVSEGNAAVYLAAPPGFKCKNPNIAHYYPPNKLLPGSKQCVLCKFAVP